MAGKKLVKTGLGIAQTSMKPKCRVHAADMVYVPEEMAWCCLVDTCEVKRRPKIEGDDAVTIITDDFTFVMVQDPTGGQPSYFLRSEKHSLMVNVTKHVKGSDINGPVSGTYMLHLLFDTMTLVQV